MGTPTEDAGRHLQELVQLIKYGKTFSDAVGMLEHLRYYLQLSGMVARYEYRLEEEFWGSEWQKQMSEAVKNHSKRNLRVVQVAARLHDKVIKAVSSIFILRKGSLWLVVSREERVDELIWFSIDLMQSSDLVERLSRGRPEGHEFEIVRRVLQGTASSVLEITDRRMRVAQHDRIQASLFADWGTNFVGVPLKS